MRRALVVCLVGFAIIVAFADAQKDAPSLTQASVGIQPTVVADGITAREIALNPDSSVFLSMESSLNRIFELLTPTLSNSSNFESNLAPVAGTGVAGSLGDGGAARIAQLSLLENNLYRRSAFAFGRDGTLYIADSENATVRSVAGSQSTEPGIIRSIAGRWAPRQNVALVKPVGLAIDRAGNLYIADNGAGALDVLYANTGTLKSVAQIADASGIAVTGDGTRAFVTSPKSGSVVSVNLQVGSIQTLSISGGQSMSQPPTAESPSPCSATPPQQIPSGFCPSGVAVDGAGNLFLSDLWNGRVLRVDTHSGAQAAVLSGLNEPGALSFDSSGISLFVVEQGANRIIRAEAGSPGSVLTLSPSSATFPSEPISGVSQQIQFTLTNTSSNSVSGISTTFVPMAPTPSTAKNDFTAESTSCPSILSANGTCTINVAFTPTSIGPLYYSMNVSDSVGDATNAPSLTGTGDDYQIQLASGQLQEMSVVQGNSVTYHLQVAASGVFGQNGERVSFLCPGNMPANMTCTISPVSVNPGVGSTVPFTVTFHTSSNNIYAQLPGPDSSLRGFLLILLPLIGTTAFWLRASRSRALLGGIGCIALIVFVGCHHATTTSTPTPPGSVTMTVQGAALDNTGKPLNATRGTSIILDVIAK